MLAHIPDHESWTYVIKRKLHVFEHKVLQKILTEASFDNPLNVKEMWSRHGIQA